MSGNAALMLMETAYSSSQRSAVLDGREVTSFEDLARRMLGIAEALPQLGVRRGDRVGIMLRRGADAAGAYFGALAAGAVAVVVNEQLRARQVEHILRHSGATVLISSGDVLGRLSRPPESPAGVVEVADLPAAAEQAPASLIDADVAQIVYTSGSTGLPKGVTLSHANLWAGMHTVVEYLGITAEDRIASLLPLSFDYGNNQLLCAAATGAALCVERATVPQRIVDTLRRREVTVLPAVPPLWLQLLATERFRADPLPSLRVMTNTGGRLPTDAVRRLRGCQPHADLFLMYGLTEAFRSTYLPPHDVDRKPDSIGRAIPGAEVLVLREDGTPCEPGESGQLVHRGPTVALGYWDDPEATAEVFRANPLRPRGTPDRERVVYSGDLVRRDEDGDLFFIGRRDHMIKTLGYRVSPDEVVDVVYASGQVTEAVITAEQDDERGACIVVHVVLNDGGSVDDLEQFLAEELPRYMQPSRIEVQDSLPRTSSGKHDASAMARQAG